MYNVYILYIGVPPYTVHIYNSVYIILYTYSLLLSLFPYKLALRDDDVILSKYFYSRAFIIQRFYFIFFILLLLYGAYIFSMPVWNLIIIFGSKNLIDIHDEVPINAAVVYG